MYIKENYGQEALHQLPLWEKDVIKLSHYRNHRIFILRCISHNLVPVSVQLKLTYSKLSQGARKIIGKAERQLLQDRVRCITRQLKTVATG